MPPGHSLRACRPFDTPQPWNPHAQSPVHLAGHRRGGGAGRAGPGQAGWAPATRLQIKLDLLRSFEGHNTAVFTLAPQGAATTVTGSMTGPMPFVSKLMSVFVSMDRLIGEDFEAGLAKMKVAAEKPGA